MFNGDPSLNTLSTEMIQKYLEENKELILAALEGQNLGKFAEVAQYQAKLQQNLSYLAKLADAVTQPLIEPQGQAMQQPHVAISQQQPHVAISQQQPHVAMSQQQPHVAMSQQHPHVAMSQQHPHVAMSQQQPHIAMSQQQPHIAMSQQQPELSTLNLPFDLNDQQQQHHHHLAMSLQQHGLSASKLPFQMNEQQPKLPDFLQQQQQFMPGPMGSFPSTNSSIYQTLPIRLGNLSDTPESSQIGSDVGPYWSLGMSPSGPY